MSKKERNHILDLLFQKIKTKQTTSSSMQFLKEAILLSNKTKFSQIEKYVKSKVGTNEKLTKSDFELFRKKPTYILEKENDIFSMDDNLFDHVPREEQKEITMNDVTITIPEKFCNSAKMVNIKVHSKVKSEDLFLFTKRMTNLVMFQLQDFFYEFGSYKIVFGLEVKMTQVDVISHQVNTITCNFQSGAVKDKNKMNTGMVILNVQNLQNVYFEAMDTISQKVDEFMKMGSNWVLEGVERLILKCAKYDPAAGASFLELPDEINKKHCCINIKNKDEKCFQYSVLCGLYHLEIKKDLQRVTKYEPYKNILKFDNIEFPVKIDDVSLFETLNNIAINVFGLNEENEITILYTHKYKSEKKVINLLLIV